ncbi:hypothetical protein EH165_12310 [Nakamurella antarctica]|uniref:Membrane-anchored protein n=1 Tax=Nakamurella antarctica TaxID=1902245 RepID=A0A3G8ZN93_9ACTN|nr:hypothetical protein [Nakamurella antarctica]AZI58802.1 hypothetical protein EH165_12310 [Nakamurella antarctica]
MTRLSTEPATLQRLNKVPEITVYFWIIKILCTTVGETAADYLNVNLNLGLSATSVVMGLLLAVVLVLQFKSRRYVPALYWLAVALVSVFGTLVTDNLTDKAGLPLETSTLIFATLLGATFFAWYRAERTLSMHSIFTTRREAFYWLTILFTFALGTATGDLLAEKLGLGYSLTGVIVASIITLVAVAWRFGLHSILSFWIIYVLTRPLGAAIGDYLSQPAKHGGLGLGAPLTSVIFFTAIGATVAYLAVKKIDVSAIDQAAPETETVERGGRWQTLLVVSLFVIAGTSGYYLRTNTLNNERAMEAAQSASSGVPVSVLGDLSVFRDITQDSLTMLTAGDQAGATTRIADLEFEWDAAASLLKAKDQAEWTVVDKRIDTVLREFRSTTPNPVTETTALQELLKVLG